VTDRPIVPEPDVPPPPAPAPRAAPDLVDAFAALLALVGVQFVVGGIGVALLAAAGVEVAGAPLLAVVLGSQLATLVVLAAIVRVRGRPLRLLAGPERARAVHVATGLGIGAGGVVLAYGLNALLLRWSGSTEPVEQLLLEELAAGATAVALAVVVAVVLAPITEEIAFRVLLLGALRRRVGEVPALVGSTLAFTVAHAEVAVSQPLALVGLGALGLLLGVAYLRSGTVVVPIVAHATFNAVSLGLALSASAFGTG
jgi:membrane protease YdiL (CAAX protease family)